MKKKIVTSVICLAVILVFNFALPRLMPGDTVLMSPASAAFDQFKNFMVRGDHFKKLVMEL